MTNGGGGLGGGILGRVVSRVQGLTESTTSGFSDRFGRALRGDGASRSDQIIAALFLPFPIMFSMAFGGAVFAVFNGLMPTGGGLGFVRFLLGLLFIILTVVFNWLFVTTGAYGAIRTDT